MQGCTASATAQHIVPASQLLPTSGHAGAQTREYDTSSKFHDGSAADGGDDAPGEEYVVRVKAQVMKRDESTQMWLPTRGDPWSVVGLLRRRTRQRLGSGNGNGSVAPVSDHQTADGIGALQQQPQPAPSSRPSPGPVEYIIYARRVKDGQELINCRVEAEFYYCSANPLFHHWMAAAGERRHGLAFVNARDASRFERQVRRAIADVKTGGAVTVSADPSAEEVFAAVHLPSASGPKRVSPRDLSVPSATVVHGGAAAASQLVRPVPIRSNGSGSSTLSAALMQTPPAPQTHTKPLSPMLQHRPPLPPRASSSSVSEREGSVLIRPTVAAPISTARDRDDGGGDVWVHRGDDGREQEARSVTRPALPPNTVPTTVVSETTSLQDIKRRRQYSDYRKDYYVPADKPLVIRGYIDGSPVPLLSPQPASVATIAAGTPGVPGTAGGDELLLLPGTRGKSASSTVGAGSSAPLESASALSIVSAAADPKLPTKQKRRPRLALRKLSGQQPLIASAAVATVARTGPQRCRNCHAVYHEADNPRGCCPEGNDPTMRLIERVTCSPCVDGIMYHCVNDEDSVESLDAWSCSCSGGRRRRGLLKWGLIVLLGLVLPCVWCYPPLAACHRAARRNGVSGPRHASGSGSSNGGGGSGSR